jgi:hypothetical protein
MRRHPDLRDVPERDSRGVVEELDGVDVVVPVATPVSVVHKLRTPLDPPRGLLAMVADFLQPRRLILVALGDLGLESLEQRVLRCNDFI